MARRTKAQMAEARHNELLEREALWVDSSKNLMEIVEDHMLERGATNDEINNFWDQMLKFVQMKQAEHVMGYEKCD